MGGRRELKQRGRRRREERRLVGYGRRWEEEREREREERTNLGFDGGREGGEGRYR